MSPRVFTIIRHREGTNITSSIHAVRADADAAHKEVKQLDVLIERMVEALIPERIIDEMRQEQDYYRNLFMTPTEQVKLRDALSKNNLGAIGIGVNGAGIVMHANATVVDVEDPAQAIQQVIDTHKRVITFSGAVELIYHDTMESSWIIVEDSVASEEPGTIDIYSRFSKNRTKGK